MRHDADSGCNVMTAHMGKDGPPMFGKDCTPATSNGACCRRQLAV
jgi:hypothetical protein